MLREGICYETVAEFRAYEIRQNRAPVVRTFKKWTATFAPVMSPKMHNCVICPFGRTKR